MSNVIKLHRVADRVRIEHNLGDVRSISVSRGHEMRGTLSGEQNDSDSSYAPLVDEYQRGVETGSCETEARLRKESDEQIAEERRRVEMLLTNIRDQFLQLHNRWEQAVLRFAMEVAKTIIKREISVDKEVVLGQVRASLRHVVGIEKVKLRVHSRDEEILRQQRTVLLSSSDSLREMIIEVDDSMEPGGCIVESESGNVDARISTQTSKLESVLFEQNQQEVRS